MNKKLINFKKRTIKSFKSLDFHKSILKIFLIIIVLSGLYFTSTNYSNNISLLAVNEGSDGKISGGSIIDLTLKIQKGSGEIYINLDTIEDIDTQISIINSQKIACDIFELDCDSYDFTFNFKGNALVLKGPSASSAIAILVAKTVNHEKLNDDSVITGSLNSGGVIGNVGGVDEKIEIAKKTGFERVIIPTFSDYSIFNHSGIEINPVMDIVEAYNIFTNDNFSINSPKLDNTKYLKLMEELSVDMCNRSINLRNKINLSLIDNSSDLNIYKVQAEKSFNSSIVARNNSNFYSAGSFCYNSNINYRILIERLENISQNNFSEKLKLFENQINLKLINISSNNYKNNIITINDFYVYLLLNNRIDEAREYFEEINNLDKNLYDFIKTQNLTQNLAQNLTEDLILNDSKLNVSKNSSLNLIENYKKNIFAQKQQLYSFAYERFYTVILWEKFIENYGTKINFDDAKIESVCKNINREISIKSTLLKKYGIIYLDKEIEKQNKYNLDFLNQYLCIYNGLELSGKINTILNSMGIENDKSLIYASKLNNFTKSRLSLNSNGEFPLIPYIYVEYSSDLLLENNSASSMLYSNYALSYLDLNLYLKEKELVKPLFVQTIEQSFENLIFVGALIFIIAFL